MTALKSSIKYPSVQNTFSLLNRAKKNISIEQAITEGRAEKSYNL